MTDREEVDALRAEINTINREAAARQDEYASALAEGRIERDMLRSELKAALADTARLDKVERMCPDITISFTRRPKWVARRGASAAARGATIRECIDGVPE